MNTGHTGHHTETLRGGAMSRTIGVVQAESTKTSKIQKGLDKTTRNNVKAGEFSAVPSSLKRYFPDQPTKRYIRGGTNADGSCFYHTVGMAINYEGYWEKSPKEQQRLGKEFRRVIFDSISQEAWSRFWRKNKVAAKDVPDLDDIRKQIENPSTWADVFSILFVVDVLGLNILVFDVSAGKLYCGTHNPSASRPTILMAWIHNAHFEPLLEFDTQTLKVRTLFSRRKDGRSVLDHILQLYAKEGCPNVTIHQILRRRRRRQKRKRLRRK